MTHINPAKERPQRNIEKFKMPDGETRYNIWYDCQYFASTDSESRAKILIGLLDQCDDDWSMELVKQVGLDLRKIEEALGNPATPGVKEQIEAAEKRGYERALDDLGVLHGEDARNEN